MGIQKTSKKAAKAQAAKDKKNAGKKKGVLSIIRCKVCSRAIRAVGKGKKKNVCGICSPLPKVHKSVMSHKIGIKVGTEKAKADKPKKVEGKKSKA